MPANYLPPIIAFFNDANTQYQNQTSSWVGFNSNIPLYISGKTPSSGNIDLFIGGQIPVNSSLMLVLYNANSDKIYPSGTAAMSGVWVNSDGGINNMWSYVDEDPYNSFADTTSITSYQSGYAVTPLNLYWTSESGIFKYNLASTNITKILDGNADTQLSYHIAYNNIDDFIYYGIEDGNTSYVKRIDTLGLRNTGISSSCGAGLAFSKFNNTLFSMSKDGDFKVVVNEQTTIDKTSLLGRETLIRRLRINQDTEEIYGLQTEATSYLTKVYKYNPSTGLWEYLRILTYGMFGGAFDIDYASGNIYYTATSDYFTPSYYGIVKESLVSGSGTRIVNASSPTYFQTRELAFNQSERYLYYVGEDISGANKVYNLKKCDDLGGSTSTLLSLPEHSGIQAMVFDGGIYKSYIDFDITDLSSTFAGYGASQANISSAFVSVKARNHNHYSYVRAKLFTSDKTDYIWYPNYSVSTPRIDSSGNTIGVTYDIGRNNSTVNSSYNNSTYWNNGILRVEVAASPSGNSDITTIDSINMTLVSNVSVGISTNSNITLYTKAHISENNSITLHTQSDAGVASLDLYLGAAIWSSGELPTYIYGKDVASGTLSLYTFGALPSSNFDMYLYGHDVVTGTLTMYASGLGVETGAMPLYLAAHNSVQKSGDLQLFTWSSESPSIFKAIDLFTSTINSVNPSGVMSLYVDGYGGTPRSSSMNLFIKSEQPSIGRQLDLTVGNYYSSATNSTYLTLWGPVGSLGAEYSSGTMSLVIGNGNEPVLGAIPLFINTQTETYNYIPFVLEGQPNARNYTTLFVSGIQPVFNSIKLYI